MLAKDSVEYLVLYTWLSFSNTWLSFPNIRSSFWNLTKNRIRSWVFEKLSNHFCYKTNHTVPISYGRIVTCSIFVISEAIGLSEVFIKSCFREGKIFEFLEFFFIDIIRILFERLKDNIYRVVLFSCCCKLVNFVIQKLLIAFCKIC